MTSAREGPWFDSDGGEDATQASAATPRRWPAVAVEQGFYPTEGAYYDALHEYVRDRLREEVQALSDAEDVELLRTERLLQSIETAMGDIGARRDELAAPVEGDDPPAHAVGAAAVAELGTEADRLIAQIDRLTCRVAPNLRTIAGPRLTARLIEEAGGLKRLARKPSGTVQVLGAENALFAHLQGRGPSPKHGVIYTHPAVRHAPRSERGSVARMLAGKLTIAARIDHYRGTLDEAFTTAVLDRLARVRS